MRIAIGMVRGIDDTGRIAIPSEVRKKFNWNHKDKVRLWLQGDEVIIKKVDETDNFEAVERELDMLGRVVIPKENRKILNWIERETKVEFFVEDRKVIVKEYKPGCIFCGSLDIEKTHNKKSVCSYCVGVLRG